MSDPATPDANPPAAGAEPSDAAPWIEYRGRGWNCNGSLFVPLAVILLGVMFLLQQFNFITDFRVWNFFWSFLLIFWGVNWLSSGTPRRQLIGVVAIGFGALWAVQGIGYFTFDIGRLWPVVLILVGFAMLSRGPRIVRFRDGRGPGFRASRRAHVSYGPAGEVRLETPRATIKMGSNDPTEEGWIEGTAVLGGIQRRVATQQFRGGRFEALFGGINLDLTRAEIAGDMAVLDLTSLCGGGEIRVPARWVIDLQAHAFLGAYQDETQQTAPAGAKRLLIQGTAVCGGFVIKN